MSERALPEVVVAGLTTKSDRIRALWRAGYQRAEIARHLGISYAHANNVLRQSQLLDAGPRAAAPAMRPIGGPIRAEDKGRGRPELTTARLEGLGFKRRGRWVEGPAGVRADGDLPDSAGLDAFCIAGKALYVGITAADLGKRLYFYGRPGNGQKTNLRLNPLLRAAIAAGHDVEIHTLTPDPVEWHGLSLDPTPAIEQSLLKTYWLPWNRQGVG